MKLFSNDEEFTFDDVLIVPRFSDIESRSEVDLTVETASHSFPSPILSANMDTITGVDMCIALQKCGATGVLHRYMSIDENIKQIDRLRESNVLINTIVSVGSGNKEIELKRANALYLAGATMFCVDIAHGNSTNCLKMIEHLRGISDKILIIAGNVATTSGVKNLHVAGADVVKVGVGPGSVCLTRVKTGIGRPQLSAIAACAELDVPIIADGGMRTPGDICKSLAAGAHMVMLGGMLAGCDETPGETCYGAYKTFRGMASQEAQNGLCISGNYKTEEGDSKRVRCKGPVADIIKDILGGIRSSLSYCGARNLREFRERAKFVRVSRNVAVENSAHYPE